jgi:sarcosine reductase
MYLQLYNYHVARVSFGEETKLLGGTLYINKTEFLCQVDPRGIFKNVGLDLANPGDNTRIVNVLDVLEPRCRDNKQGAYFPSPGGPIPAGKGITHALSGAAIIQAGAHRNTQGGLIDLSGPGAKYSCFSQTANIVLTLEPFPHVSQSDFALSLRTSACKAATYLTRKAIEGQQPQRVNSYTLKGEDPALPRVAYLYYLQAQGPLRDTLVYGRGFQNSFPTLLHPNEILDGAIMSSNFVIPCQKNPTYLHAHNPLILNLYQRHLRDLFFVGVVICPEFSTVAKKELAAHFSAKLLKQLRADGVIISQEGGGHSDCDIALGVSAGEKAGIKCVALINETAGVDGRQPSLVDYTPTANALVSTGNSDVLITLPAVENLLGGKKLTGWEENPQGQLNLPVAKIYTATNQLGVNKLAGVQT